MQFMLSQTFALASRVWADRFPANQSAYLARVAFHNALRPLSVGDLNGLLAGWRTMGRDKADNTVAIRSA